jgi:hypothetical protein
MRRTSEYVAVTKDEAQRRRWTFYEAVIIGLSGRKKGFSSPHQSEKAANFNFEDALIRALKGTCASRQKYSSAVNNFQKLAKNHTLS